MSNPHPDHVVVVANGRLDRPIPLIAIVDAADLVIAADGAANWLAAQEREPDILIGDLDSVEPEVLAALQAKGCQIQRYSPHKDETDTELALLEAVRRGAREITLIGALGGRIDHELANILLLTMPELHDTRTTIFDGHSYLWVIRDELTICGQVGDTVSLLPLGGDAHGIVTEGLEYPLHGESLRMGPARGVSNVLSEAQAHIRVAQGWLLAIYTPLDGKGTTK